MILIHIIIIVHHDVLMCIFVLCTCTTRTRPSACQKNKIEKKWNVDCQMTIKRLDSSGLRVNNVVESVSEHEKENADFYKMKMKQLFLGP